MERLDLKTLVRTARPTADPTSRISSKPKPAPRASYHNAASMMAEGLGLNLSELVDFDAAPPALAESKGNEFSTTPRKSRRKRSKPST